MSKKKSKASQRREALRDAKKEKKPGCTICSKDPELRQEIDDCIEELRADGTNVGYAAIWLLAAVNKMLPSRDLQPKRLRRHLRECRPGWNE